MLRWAHATDSGTIVNVPRGHGQPDLPPGPPI